VVEYLISSLRGEQVVIVSGLALGIDSLAHHAALQEKLITLSIPGSGLGRKVLYPRGHVNLAEEIVQSGGALISEYEEDQAAAQYTFPARNRIMAALSDALLVIEAEDKSGTLITARLSLELGKDIGVVPGSIFAPTSLGCNMLLKDGAAPVASKEDLFDLLHLSYEKNKDGQETKVLNLDEHERALYELLAESKSRDALISESKLSPQEVMIAITTLEAKGYIKDHFGEVSRVMI
jgi:DNA processing protein